MLGSVDLFAFMTLEALANLCLRLAKFVLVIWPLICLASCGPSPGALLTLTKVNDDDMISAY